MGAPGWAVAARLDTPLGAVDIGTGLDRSDGCRGRSGRVVRIDGETQSGSGALAEHVEMVWLTPAMDGLFTGPASERRRFLDRLIAAPRPELPHACSASSSAPCSSATGCWPTTCASRALRGLRAHHGRDRRGRRRRARRRRRRACRRDRHPARRRARRALSLGRARPRRHARGRPRRTARRRRGGRLRRGCSAASASATAPPAARSTARTAPTSIVGHGPKEMPAKVCSTGEQKALLIGLVLAHADLVASAPRRGCAGPAAR